MTPNPSIDLMNYEHTYFAEHSINQSHFPNQNQDTICRALRAVLPLFSSHVGVSRHNKMCYLWNHKSSGIGARAAVIKTRRGAGTKDFVHILGWYQKYSLYIHGV